MSLSLPRKSMPPVMPGRRIEGAFTHARTSRCFPPIAPGRRAGHRCRGHRCRRGVRRSGCRSRRRRGAAAGAHSPATARSALDDRRAVRRPSDRPRGHDRSRQPRVRDGRGLGRRPRMPGDRRLRHPRRPRRLRGEPAGRPGQAASRRVRRLRGRLHADGEAGRHRPRVHRHALGVPPPAGQGRPGGGQARDRRTARRHRAGRTVGPRRHLRAHPPAPDAVGRTAPTAATSWAC